MSTRMQNQLTEIRRARGIAAADLAQRVGVTRQTIYAIEAGSYMPNTGTALKLARELEVPVEALFSLAEESPAAPAAVTAQVLGAARVEKGRPVRLGQVGRQLVAVPVSATPYYLPEADCLIVKPGRGRVSLAPLAKDEDLDKRLVVAGCDPAIGLVSRMVERTGGVEIVPAAASSKLALEWLEAGQVHVAGSHLEDPVTGEFNLPFLRPGGGYAVVTFATWEEGFVVAPGNPRGIRQAEDLAHRGVRFVNREPGSGSRALADRLLKRAGVPVKQVAGYERVARGHLAAAYAVLAGDADCCLATQSAARAFGLDFVPVQSERYDFILRRETLDTPAAQALVDVLQRAALRRKLEALAGYDTRQTGARLA